MEYMLAPYKNYFGFSGRARRKEYWLYILFFYIVYFIVMFLDSALGLGGTTQSYSTYDGGSASAGFSSSGGILSMIWVLLNLIPMIAVGVRRMHDVDKSGWFLLIPIYNLILACTDGTAGPNRFGPDPKGR